MSDSKNWSPSAVKAEAVRLFKNAMNEQQIFENMRYKVPSNQWDDDLLKSAISDGLRALPNYNEMLDILDGQLAINKIDDREKIHVFNKNTMTIDKIAKANISLMFKKFDYASRVKFCHFEYRPDVFKQFFQDEKGKWIFNTYEPPYWLREFFYKGEPIPKAELPELYERFFKHLLNDDKESYEYFLDWFANALKGRNMTYFTIITKRGVGKGTLGEIFQQVFGKPNYVRRLSNAFMKEFNSFLEGKKLFFLDELKISNNAQNDRVKDLVNDSIEIEGKGVDSKTVPNYINVFIASNEEDGLPLTSDNRRYSVAEATEVKFLDVFSEQDYDDLIKNEDNIKQLSCYLWHRKFDKSKMSRILKTKRTEEIRNASLKNWEEFFIDEICPKYASMTIPADDIIEEIQEKYRYTLSQNTFKKFRDRFPEYYTMVRPRIDGRGRPQCLKFADKETILKLQDERFRDED